MLLMLMQRVLQLHRLEGDALLHCALKGLNSAVLAEAKAAAAGRDPLADPSMSPGSPLQPELADLFEAAGLDDPLEKARLTPLVIFPSLVALQRPLQGRLVLHWPHVVQPPCCL